MNKIVKKQNLVLIFLYLIFVSACFSPDKPSQSETASPISEENFEVPNTNINLAQPLVVSNQPKDVARCEKINKTIEESEFANARWGVITISLKDGRVVCEKEARKLFNPASIQKILISIVALDKLGAEFRWQTKILSGKEIENGILDGDITVYGQGAPDFDEVGLEDLANQLQAKGLKQVKGSVVGDESYFKGDDIGDGWTWNDLQWHYGAEAGALTFRENQANVFMKDGKPISSTDYLQVQSELEPKQAGKTEAFGIKRGLADNQVYIWGNGEKASGRLAVHNSSLWAAKNLKALLERKGIAVDGETKSVDWKSKDRLNVENAVELAVVESKTLAEIVQKMNKRSLNIYAELLLRTVGKRFGDTAPDESRQITEVRGDDSAGASLVKKFLRENKVATDEIQIRDGSGLSRLDFVTPEAFGRALIYAAQSKFADVFIGSLPIAATDGTLGGRLGKAKGKILAKTGSITFVNSLAGYAQAADGEILTFAVISNNVTRKSDSSRVIDSIATILTEKLSPEKD